MLVAGAHQLPQWQRRRGNKSKWIHTQRTCASTSAAQCILRLGDDVCKIQLAKRSAISRHKAPSSKLQLARVHTEATLRCLRGTFLDIRHWCAKACTGLLLDEGLQLIRLHPFHHGRRPIHASFQSWPNLSSSEGLCQCSRPNLADSGATRSTT